MIHFIKLSFNWLIFSVHILKKCTWTKRVTGDQSHSSFRLIFTNGHICVQKKIIKSILSFYCDLFYKAFHSIGIYFRFMFLKKYHGLKELLETNNIPHLNLFFKWTHMCPKIVNKVYAYFPIINFHHNNEKNLIIMVSFYSF